MPNIKTNAYVVNEEVHKENKIKTDEISKDIRDNKEEYEKFFLVHGHDDGVKNEVDGFLENLELESIILHGQSSSGDTIIEKIEHYSNVGFRIVLYILCR